MKKIGFSLALPFLLLFTPISNAQQIIIASKEGNLEKVTELVNKDPNCIKHTDEYKRTPLHWAARGVHYDVLKFLIEKSADVNAKDTNNITALISAGARKHQKAVKLLIDNGADVNIASSSKQTALHYAAADGFHEIVKLLVDHGAKLELKNDYGRTPLLKAARETGGIETVKILVEAGADINVTDYSKDSPITLAAWRGYEDIVNYLIDKSATLGANKEKTKHLLFFAVNKRLIKLYHAIQKKGHQIKQLSPKGFSVLHMAAKGGSKVIISDLIKKGFKVNEKDVFGWTPLHYAANYGRLEAVQTLIKYGAKIDAKTKDEQTAINLAKKANHKDVSDLLLKSGAKDEENKLTSISGNYFGEKSNIDKPKIFAPGIVTDQIGGHSNVVFSPDGTMAAWTRWIESEKGYALGSLLMFSQIENGKWTVPKILMKFGDTPFFSHNGKKLFFLKKERKENGELIVHEIQFFEISDSKLGKLKTLPFDLEKSGLYWQFSFDKDENLYFSGRNGLCRSMLKNGEYQSFEKLTDVFHPDYKGSSPYISPNADYLIFSSMDLPESFGRIDLYIGFRKPDGTWTKPINMGAKINTPKDEHLPIVTHNGKYLFFSAWHNELPGKYLYWMDAKIIEALKSQIK